MKLDSRCSTTAGSVKDEIYQWSGVRDEIYQNVSSGVVFWASTIEGYDFWWEVAVKLVPYAKEGKR
jgi:hypothetical protein